MNKFLNHDTEEKPGFVKQALAYLKKWEGTCSIQKQD